jgi:hypothetical protein
MTAFALPASMSAACAVVNNIAIAAKVDINKVLIMNDSLSICVLPIVSPTRVSAGGCIGRLKILNQMFKINI